MKYQTEPSLAPEDAALERHNLRSVDAEMRALSAFGKLVADGSLSYSEALDSLVSAYLARGGDVEQIDAVEAGLGKALTWAAERAVVRQEEANRTIATPRRDMDPLVIVGLGIDMERPIMADELKGLSAGRRTDGEKIAGKVYAKPRPNSTPIGSYDFTPTPDKSVSVAWAFAQPVERAIIYNAHVEAAREAVGKIASEIGVARRGKGGLGGKDKGHVGWVEFNHHTARPVKGHVADPNIHTHFVVVNAVFCENGHVGSLSTKQLGHVRYQADRLYHAALRQRLDDAGFGVAMQRGVARMTAVPEQVRQVFSKKAADGEAQVTRSIGAEAVTPGRRAALVKSAIQRGKRPKEGVADFAAWQRQAEAIGWKAPGTFLERAPKAWRPEPMRHIAVTAAELVKSAEKVRAASVRVFQQALHPAEQRRVRGLAPTVVRETLYYKAVARGLDPIHAALEVAVERAVDAGKRVVRVVQRTPSRSL